MKFLKTKAAKVDISDLMTATTKIIERLEALEKKMDLVLSQTSVRHSGGHQYPKPATPQVVPPSAFRQPNSSPRPNEVKPVQVSVQGHPQNQPQGKPHGRAHERRERMLHKAVCADCQKDCEIPFKPTGERPVYCKECFSKRKSGNSFKGNSGNRPASEPAKAPVEVNEPQRQVIVTKKGVGKVTVSEIVRPSAREISSKKISSRPAKKSK